MILNREKNSNKVVVIKKNYIFATKKQENFMIDINKTHINHFISTNYILLKKRV